MTVIEHVEIAAGAWQLRPPDPRDAEEALVMLADPETRRWNDAADVVDIATARDWCERGADWTEGAHATFSVLDATTALMKEANFLYFSICKDADVGSCWLVSHNGAFPVFCLLSGFAACKMMWGTSRNLVFRAEPLTKTVSLSRMAERTMLAISSGSLVRPPLSDDGIRSMSGLI